MGKNNTALYVGGGLLAFLLLTPRGNEQEGIMPWLFGGGGGGGGGEDPITGLPTGEPGLPILDSILEGFGDILSGVLGGGGEIGGSGGSEENDLLEGGGLLDGLYARIEDLFGGLGDGLNMPSLGDGNSGIFGPIIDAAEGVSETLGEGRVP